MAGREASGDWDATGVEDDDEGFEKSADHDLGATLGAGFGGGGSGFRDSTGGVGLGVGDGGLVTGADSSVGGGSVSVSCGGCL